MRARACSSDRAGCFFGAPVASCSSRLSMAPSRSCHSGIVAGRIDDGPKRRACSKISVFGRRRAYAAQRAKSTGRSSVPAATRLKHEPRPGPRPDSSRVPERTSPFTREDEHATQAPIGVPNQRPHVDAAPRTIATPRRSPSAGHFDGDFLQPLASRSRSDSVLTLTNISGRSEKSAAAIRWRWYQRSILRPPESR